MRKILAIHPHKDPLTGFAEQLEQLFPGSTILSAQSWEEGLAKARECHPDMIVTEESVQQRIKELEKELTQHRNVVERLKQGEDRYRQLIHTSNDGIYLLFNRKFQVINEKFASMFNVDIDYVNRPEFDFMELVAPRSREFIEERHRKIAVGEEVDSRYEFTALTRDGIELEVEASVSLIRYNDGYATQGVIRDITDRKRLESRLRRSQKIEALSTLAGGIAHDFNNILAIIRGYTELVLEDLSAQHPLAGHNLQHVISAADRAKDLVNQILTFSRQGEDHREAVNIYDIAREVISTIQATLPAYIEIKESLRTPDAVVMAGQSQVRQMIVNLCSNALHAMRESGGVLEIKLDRIEIDEGGIPDFSPAEPGPYVKLTVKDTGHGMGDAVAERIFEPYFTTKATGEGSGMGLAVIYGIVKSYGGEITVFTEPQKGTAFHLYLPLVKEEEHDAGNVISRPNGLESLPHGQERIILVEQADSLSHMQQDVLEPLGYQVMALPGAIEALDAFEADSEIFDLAIISQDLSDMPGLELAARFIEIKPDIAVVMCTGFGSNLTRDAAIKAGVKGFIMKPVIVREIAGVIRKVLEPKRKIILADDTEHDVNKNISHNINHNISHNIGLRTKED